MKRSLLLCLLLVLFAPSLAHADSLTTCTPTSDTAQCTADSYRCTCTSLDKTYGPFTGAEGATAVGCASVCATYAGDASYNWYLTCTKKDTAETGTVASCTVTTSSTASSSGETARNAVIPVLNVPIPGLDFGTAVETDEAGNQKATFLAKYIDALYRYLIVAAAIIAVVMMMIGGLQYILSRGHADAVKQAKSRITNAVIGLVILFAAYDIAFLINPDTVRFDALTIKTVKYEDTPEEFSEELASYGQTAEVVGSDVMTIDAEDATRKHLVVETKEKYIGTQTYNALVAAASDFFTSTQDDGHAYNIRLTSASRSLTAQAELFYGNCIANGGYCSPDTCNIDGSDTTVVRKENGRWILQDAYASYGESAIVAALVAHGKGSNCMHTNNVAVDVWPDEAASDYTFDVPLQNAMTTALLENGFCRIPNEPWHFELETLASSSCKTNSHKTSDYTRKVNGVRTTYSTTGCKKWSYKKPANCCVAALDNTQKPPTMCK